MDTGSSRAKANRKLRQDALREYLSERGSVQYLLDLIEKVDALDTTHLNFDKELAKLKVSIDQRQKLLGRYLPELKATEVDLQADVTVDHPEAIRIVAELDENP
jgi:hypothetical protein